MIKNLPMSLDMLGKLLGLPEGVTVVAVRQSQFRQVEFTLIDPENRIPLAAVFDVDTRQWLPKEQA